MGVDSHLFLGKGICVYTHKMKKEEYEKFMEILDVLSEYMEDFEFFRDAYQNKPFIFFPTSENKIKEKWSKYTGRHPILCCPEKEGATTSSFDNYTNVMTSSGYADNMPAFAVMLGGYELSDKIRSMYIDDYFTYNFNIDKIESVDGILEMLNLDDENDDEEKISKRDKMTKHIKENFRTYLTNPNYSLPGKWLVYWCT